MSAEFPVANLSNQALLEITELLATNAHRATTKLIAALAEVDARKLWADVGCSSLYAFCTEVLHFSEQEAYLRMEAARVARRFPVALEMLEEGELTLTNIGLLKPHLTADNHAALLEGARGKTKREVARQIAALREDDRQLSRGSITMVSGDRYRVQFEIRYETYDKLLRATDLLRHAVPDGSVADVFDRALTSLTRDLERVKCAVTDHPRQPFNAVVGSRRIPAHVRRAVWLRDGGRCAFRGTLGRCTATASLEFHHLKPFAVGGESSVDNIELRCRAHNQREAEVFFGAAMPSVVREGMLEYGQLGLDPVSHHPPTTPCARPPSTHHLVQCADAMDRRERRIERSASR